MNSKKSWRCDCRSLANGLPPLGDVFVEPCAPISTSKDNTFNHAVLHKALTLRFPFLQRAPFLFCIQPWIRRMREPDRDAVLMVPWTHHLQGNPSSRGILFPKFSHNLQDKDKVGMYSTLRLIPGFPSNAKWRLLLWCAMHLPLVEDNMDFVTVKTSISMLVF